MAVWHLFLQVQTGNVINKNDIVKVIFNDKDSYSLPNEESPVAIVSGDIKLPTYKHFAFSAEWTEGGFLFADGTPINEELQELEKAGMISSVIYNEDFSCELAQGWELSHILLYDKDLNQLRTLYDSADLAKLENGIYYVGMVVSKEGEYIEEADDHEYSGFVCAFKLCVGTIDIRPFSISPDLGQGVVDIDDDGINEDYIISYGPTSGLFTFIINVSENGEEEYMNIYNSSAYQKLYFTEEEERVLLIGITQDGDEHIFEVEIADGNIALHAIKGGEAAEYTQFWGPQL